MKTQKMSLDSVRLDDRNARTHDDKNLETIANSLDRFGQQKPIVIDGDGVVIAGNRTSDLSDWHYNTLIDELGNLEADMQEAIGFSEEDIAELIKSPLFESEEVVEDEAPEPPVDPVTRLGDLLLLGKHRLICGDSTANQSIDRLIGREQVDAVITDPPYGTGIDAASGLGNSSVPMQMIGDADNKLASRAVEAWANVCSLQIWWGANYYADSLNPSSCWAVWDKDHHGMTFADAELAWVSSKGPVRVFRHAWSGSHRASEKGVKRQHPTQKPVALQAWVLNTWCKNAIVVADPFLGSGTTLIAAEQLGKSCYGMEIDPAYCDVIVERWEKLTGETAERIREGD